MNKSNRADGVPPLGRLVRIGVAASYCGVSETTFRLWTKKPGFPGAFHPTERTVLYDLTKVDQWLDGIRFN